MISNVSDIANSRVNMKLANLSQLGDWLLELRIRAVSQVFFYDRWLSKKENGFICANRLNRENAVLVS